MEVGIILGRKCLLQHAPATETPRDLIACDHCDRVAGITSSVDSGASDILIHGVKHILSSFMDQVLYVIVLYLSLYCICFSPTRKK